MSDGPILITGAAGFIGFHVARQLLVEGRDIVGLDNLNSYYDPELKLSRLKILRAQSRFIFKKADIADRQTMVTVFTRYRFPVVIHLAAQAGVRYSIDHPHAYVEANLDGFINVLEGCRHNNCRHLIYASSSSVYGANTEVPFSVAHKVDRPVSLYAATKRANELMAHCYSHLYRLPATGLRFFTVYGPWMRPDMAVYLFANAIAEGKPIKLFNHGNMRRDFTYVDDVCRTLTRLIDLVPVSDAINGGVPARIYNVGNNHPEDLMHVVSVLEREFGKVAFKEMLPMQPGDIAETYADVADLERDIGFKPETSIERGIAEFAKWYRDYHKV